MEKLELTGRPREKRRGLLLNITGDGKGKSTAAFGTLFRALGYGWQAAVVQFIKDGRPTGEAAMAARLPEQLRWHRCGGGFSFRPGADAAADRQLAFDGWRLAQSYLAGGDVDLLILDELNIALQLNWLDLAAVVDALQRRPAWLHVIVTGRNAPAALLDISDLVSEIKDVRHPYAKGIAAQSGIDF